MFSYPIIVQEKEENAQGEDPLSNKNRIPHQTKLYQSLIMSTEREREREREREVLS